MGNSLSCLRTDVKNEDPSIAAAIGKGAFSDREGKRKDACVPNTGAKHRVEPADEACHPTSQTQQDVTDSCGFSPLPEGGPNLDSEPLKPTGQPWPLALRGMPYSPNDAERRQTGMALGIYTASKCSELDLIMRVIAGIFEAPYTSLALYYNRCCWLTNGYHWTQGLLPWQVSACPWNTLVKQPQCIVCGEVKEDARFHHQPWAESGLRCYVSAPLLTSNGHRLGTVCFLDQKPRRVDAGMCRVLSNLGELAVRIIERHLQLAQRLANAQQALPPALTTLVNAAESGADVRRHPSATGRCLRGLDEGAWEENEDANNNAEAGRGVSGSAVVKPAEMLLADAYARQLRNVEELREACCLVVDTGTAGWPVLYADNTWKTWAGYSRQDILGRPLHGLLCPASPGMAPLNWAAWQHEVNAGERFVVPGVMAVHPSQCSAQSWSSVVRPSTTGLPHDDEHLTSPVHQPRHDSQPKGKPLASKSATPQDLDMMTAKRSALSNKQQQQIAVLPSPTRVPPSSVSPSLQQSKPSLSVDAFANVSLETQSNVDREEAEEDLIETVAALEGLHSVSHAHEHAGVEWHEAAGAFFPNENPHNVSHKGLSQNSALFNVHRSAVSSSGIRAFNMSFRPMALDVLDEDALPTGVPSWVPLETCPTMLRLYAVRLHACTAQPLPPQPLTPTLKVTNRTQSALKHLASQLFPGLRIGQVLGRGGYGTAYTGTWHDSAVVVKVQDHQLDSEEVVRTAQVEIALGQMLRHPHLVRTLAHGAAEVNVSANPNSQSGSSFAPTTSYGQNGAAGAAASVGEQQMPTPGPAMALGLSYVRLHSGFSPLADLLAAADKDWDEFGDSNWFSHCSKEHVLHRVLARDEKVQQLASCLPAVTDFVNSVAIAADGDALAAILGEEAPSSLTVIPTRGSSAVLANEAPVSPLQDEHPPPPTLTNNPDLDDFPSLSRDPLHNKRFLLHSVTPCDSLDGHRGAAGGAVVGILTQSPRAAMHNMSSTLVGSVPEDAPLRVNSLTSREMLNVLKVVYQPIFKAVPTQQHTQQQVGPHPQRVNAPAVPVVASPALPVTTTTTTTTPAAAAAAAVQQQRTSGGLASVAGSCESSSVMRSAGSTGFSAEVEMAAMLEAGRLHASRVGAKPMQFPMHLRTLAILEFCDGGTL